MVNTFALLFLVGLLLAISPAQSLTPGKVAVDDIDTVSEGGAAPLAAEDTDITGCPYAISASGTYYLANDVSTSGTCITINAANVTLDCQGRKVTGTGTSGIVYGIYNPSSNNVTVKNCVVSGYNAQAFEYGIAFGTQNCLNAQGPKWGLIHNNTLSANWQGIYLCGGTFTNISGNKVNNNSNVGIFMDHMPSNNTISDNRVTSTSGAGIAEGGGNCISDNNFTNNVLSSNQVGISLWVGCSNRITGNTIYASTVDGIDLSFGGSNIIANNSVSGSAQWDIKSVGNSVNTVVNLTTGQNLISFTSKDVSIKGLASGPADPAGYKNIGKYVNATNNSGDSWLNLNFSYSGTDVSGVNESSLRMWKNNGAWLNASFFTANGVDTARKIVYANLTKLGGIIAPLGIPTATIPAAQKVMLSEIYYQTPDDLQDQFIELYVWDDAGREVNVSGWKVTAFNGENGTLPYISGVGNFTYFVIRGGNGTNDLNASDGNATIYLNLPSPMLNRTGDEVAVYDANGTLVDYVRFGGGNGGPLLGNWPSGDPGIVANNTNESIQVHGADYDASINWESGPTSENAPNIYEWVMNPAAGLRYQIHNGAIHPMYADGSPLDSSRYILTNASRPLNDTEIKIITEMLDYTYGYLVNNESFTGGPETDANGKVHVTVYNNGRHNGTCSGAGGVMAVDLSDFETDYDYAMNKQLLEHEQTHLFQYKQRGQSFGPTSDWGELEGEAEFWSIEITMEEFNLTWDEFIGRTGYQKHAYWMMDTNMEHDPFTDFQYHLDAGNPVVLPQHYGANLLVLRYIRDHFGIDKVRHIFRVANASAGVTGIKAIDQAFKEEGKNDTFKSIFPDFMKSLWQDEIYRGAIHPEHEDTFDGGAQTYPGTLNKWGTLFEDIQVTSENPYALTFTGTPGQEYSITIVAMNGSVETYTTYTFTGSITIDFPIGGAYDELYLIKSQLGGETNSTFNVTLKSYRVIDGCDDLPVPNEQYKLEQDIPNAPQHCMYIQGDGITLDCNGHYIIGNPPILPPAGMSKIDSEEEGGYTVIGSDMTLSGVTVKNCNLVHSDIEFWDLNNGNIKNNQLYDSRILVTGNSNLITNNIGGTDTIADVEGDNNVISGNRLIGIPGEGYVPDSSIYTWGSGNSILNNSVSRHGIAVDEGSDNVVTGNNVTNSSTGISLFGNSNGLVYGNSLSATANGYDDGSNQWNSSATGNTWGDFASNPGFPTRYLVPGPGGSIDWHPNTGQICTDGTPANSCSVQKPLYCIANLTLVSLCNSCGCPGSAPVCNFALGTCSNRCSDGTLLNQCSTQRPYYCSASGLVGNCGSCGCPVDAPICLANGACKSPYSGGGGRGVKPLIMNEP